MTKHRDKPSSRGFRIPSQISARAFCLLSTRCQWLSPPAAPDPLKSGTSSHQLLSRLSHHSREEFIAR
jgi:hypothetical protein